MSTTGWTKTVGDHRREDLRWMAETGESATGAAQRLNLTLAALEKWCRRNEVDLWHQLLANEPTDHNADMSRTKIAS